MPEIPAHTIRPRVGDSTTRQIIPKFRTSKQIANPYARFDSTVNRKEGRLPNSAMLTIGLRAPRHKAEYQSDPRKDSPMKNPNIRMPASPSAKPKKLYPRRTRIHKAGKDSKGILTHNSLSEGICAMLMLLVSSLQSGPAFKVVRNSTNTINPVPASAAPVSQETLFIRCEELSNSPLLMIDIT
jgi:hypothetical protein